MSWLIQTASTSSLNHWLPIILRRRLRRWKSWAPFAWCPAVTRKCWWQCFTSNSMQPNAHASRASSTTWTDRPAHIVMMSISKQPSCHSLMPCWTMDQDRRIWNSVCICATNFWCWDCSQSSTNCVAMRTKHSIAIWYGCLFPLEDLLSVSFVICLFSNLTIYSVRRVGLLWNGQKWGRERVLTQIQQRTCGHEERDRDVWFASPQIEPFTSLRAFVVIATAHAVTSM